MDCDKKSIRLSSGAFMPTAGLGTWKSEKAKVGDAVRAAVACQYRHFDCAAIYGNEGEVGEALNEALQGGTVERKDLFITTKLWNTEHQADKVKPALEKSLALLKLQYVDLYLMHWPIALKEEGGFDVDTHFTETWKAMEELVRCGLARHIGLSNFKQEQVEEVLSMARIPPAVLQVECHPYLSQAPLVDFCQQHGVVVTAYCPLARADFPRPDRPGNLLQHPAVVDIARAHNATPAQVLLRFQVERGVTVIPKSVTRSRVEENIQLFHFSLSAAEMSTLHAVNVNWRVLTNERDQRHPLFPFPPA